MGWCIWYDFFQDFSKEIHEQKSKGWVVRVGHQKPYASHVPTSRRPSGKLNCFHKADSFEITGSEVRNWMRQWEGGNWGTLWTPINDWGTLGKIRGITTPPLKNPTRFYFFESKLYVVLSKSFFIPRKLREYDPTVFKRRSFYLKWVEVAQLAKEVRWGLGWWVPNQLLNCRSLHGTPKGQCRTQLFPSVLGLVDQLDLHSNKDILVESWAISTKVLCMVIPKRSQKVLWCWSF